MPHSQPHVHGFTGSYQILSKEPLHERSYFEIDWKSPNTVGVAVSYKDIEKTDWFGKSPKAWLLVCSSDGSCSFFHKNHKTDVQGFRCVTIGVYLDQAAGVLAFYNVFNGSTMKLLHQLRTRFTQQLYVGLLCRTEGSFAKIVKVWE